jgi:hypothetical protein
LLLILNVSIRRKQHIAVEESPPEVSSSLLTDVVSALSAAATEGSSPLPGTPAEALRSPPVQASNENVRHQLASDASRIFQNLEQHDTPTALNIKKTKTKKVKEISSESQNSTSATSDKSCLQQRNASEQEALLLKPQPHQLRTDLRRRLCQPLQGQKPRKRKAFKSQEKSNVTRPSNDRSSDERSSVERPNKERSSDERSIDDGPKKKKKRGHIERPKKQQKNHRVIISSNIIEV